MVGDGQRQLNGAAPDSARLLPGLAITVIAATAASVRWLDARPEQEWHEIPALLIAAATFIRMQWLHLRMIERSFRRG